MKPPDATRLLVAGVGPLPPEAPDRLHAPGLRVWGMARELALAGHPVRLAALRPWGGAADRIYLYDLAPGSAALPPAREVGFGPDGLAAALVREAGEFRAAAAVGSTDVMNLALARMESPLPLWLDFFGDPMAERQMLAWLHGSDDGLADQWRALAPALARADRLSGCSRRQVGALEGQMASLGRLNRHTAELRLVARVPPWIEPVRRDDGAEPILRGRAAPADALIALQTGGFNSWLDVETLFAALEIAMQAVPRLRFAATGGAIAGHNDRTFARFERLVADSPRRERYHLLGWLPLGQVPRALEESDFGMNVDLPCLEGWHGTRNRLLDWAVAGLPVVSTLGSELAAEMAAEGWLAPAPQGDPAALADVIIKLAEGIADAKIRARAAHPALMDRYAAARALAPLLEWARDPQPAPDLVAWREGSARPPALWLHGVDAAGAAAAAQEDVVRLARAEARLRAMEGSRIVRAAIRVRDSLRRR